MSDLGRIDSRTKLIGLLAKPATHSLSPQMHNLSFQKLGLNYVYMAFTVGRDELAGAVAGMRALDVHGCNVSMPNKIKIIPFLDELSPASQYAEAVNTIVNENGKLIGHLTDGSGYMRGLEEAGVDFVGKKMTLLGAGGAATAIAIQAALDGVAEVSIFNRDDEFFPRAVINAKIINERLQDRGCKANVYRIEDREQLKAEISDSDILANATNVGMNPLYEQSLILDTSWLRPELTVSDAVYNPQKTKLLEQAESVGCKIVNGLAMMLWQGAEAFKIWTGQDMPVEYVKAQMFP